MKDISIYFSPLDGESFEFSEETVGSVIQKNDEFGFPELKKGGIALVHLPENRKGEENATNTPIDFRKEFYKLYLGDNWNVDLYDLGTILPGEKYEDSHYALKTVVSDLSRMDIIPVVIGGSQDLLRSCYQGVSSEERMVNICSIDSKIDLGNPEEEVDSNGYVSQILMERPCHLFNYAVIGVQRPFVSKSSMDLFDKLYFDVVRLGAFQSDFKIAEPHLRNSDIVNIDFSAVKNSETCSSSYPNRNGFSSAEICQIARYSGISDKLSCFGIFNLKAEANASAHHLLAQTIWYFIDGVANRVSDFPIGNRKNYQKFMVDFEGFEDDLVFYKSDKSARWWLEVSYPSMSEGKFMRHQLVPCDYEDYQKALQNEIPDLWWKTLQKLNA